jgi:hypothetical protein
MQNRHPPVRNQPNENLPQFAQVSFLSPVQLQSLLHSAASKLFECGNID